MNTLLYIMLCLIWGSTWMAIKIGIQDAPPVWAAGIRILSAGLLLILFHIFRGRHLPRGLHSIWRIAWPGILIYGLSYGLVYIGTQHISSALTSILFASFPFFIILLAPILIVWEKIAFRSVIGVFIGFIGIVVVFAGPISLDRDALWGAALVIIGTAASAYGTVHVKAYLGDQPVLSMMALQMTLGGLLLVIGAILTESLSRFEVTPASIGSIVYLTLIGSIIAFAGYFWLLKRIATLTLSLIAFITPIIAMYLGYIFLNEHLTGQDYMGAAMVLAGVLLARTRKEAGFRLFRGQP